MTRSLPWARKLDIGTHEQKKDRPAPEPLKPGHQWGCGHCGYERAATPVAFQFYTYASWPQDAPLNEEDEHIPQYMNDGRYHKVWGNTCCNVEGMIEQWPVEDTSTNKTFDCWAASEDGPWHDDYSQFYADIQSDIDDCWPTAYRGKSRRLDHTAYAPQFHADQLIEAAQEEAFEHVGEVSEHYLSKNNLPVAKHAELEAHLKQAWTNWLDKNKIPVRIYEVTSTEEFRVDLEDEEIELLIEYWHENTTGKEVHEFLGMSWDKYGERMKKGAKNNG